MTTALIATNEQLSPAKIILRCLKTASSSDVFDLLDLKLTP